MDPFPDPVTTMQNSELFRRGVVVPLDDDALGRIRASNVLEHTSVKYAGIADGSDFEWLWERDFFARINAETGSMLDDYEEDELRVDATDAVALLASMFGQRQDAPDGIKRFCRMLSDVCVVAKTKGYPLFFVL